MSASVRACVRLRESDVLCVCINVCTLHRPKERPELSVAFEFDPLTSFYNVFYIFI